MDTLQKIHTGMVKQNMNTRELFELAENDKWVSASLTVKKAFYNDLITFRRVEQGFVVYVYQY